MENTLLASHAFSHHSLKIISEIRNCTAMTIGFISLSIYFNHKLFGNYKHYYNIFLQGLSIYAMSVLIRKI